MRASRRSGTSSTRWASSPGLDRSRRFERDHLPAFLLAVSRAAAEELDPAGNHLESTPPLPVGLPRAGLEPSVDGDAPSLAEILGAQLRLPVPRRHAHEVRAAVLARTVDREHEARDLLVGPDRAQLDLGCEVADQRHHVHAEDVRRGAVTARSRLCAVLRIKCSGDGPLLWTDRLR